MAALSAFRKAVKDPSKVLETWDSGLTDACTWIHIKCSPDNHVIRVDLGNSNLTGYLPTELGSLEHLQYLELYKNKLQ
ncbi:hypothetical protein GUI04_08380, partial [Xanthomonas citri pv. citri]|nr:hypothetical protein [Xanthomonas citri pv. citri]